MNIRSGQLRKLRNNEEYLLILRMGPDTTAHNAILRAGESEVMYILNGTPSCGRHLRLNVTISAISILIENIQ